MKEITLIVNRASVYMGKHAFFYKGNTVGIEKFRYGGEVRLVCDSVCTN